jgi:hypothetical protein
MRLATLVAVVLVLLSAIGATAQTQNGQIRIAYGDVPPGADAAAHARDVLAKSQALEELRRFLTPLRLPTNLNVRADSCGAARRAYDAGSKTVTICYEMIADILKIAAAQTDASEADRTGAIVGTIVEALFHETAFGLFDLYKVPVWGRIEDAADRLSALIMLQFGEDNARTTILGTARFFLWSARTWNGSDFSSIEAPEAQRFYNFLCIAYGGDPITFYNLKSSGVLPDYRINQCAYEYQQVRKAFDLRLMPAIDPDLLVKARAQTW